MYSVAVAQYRGIYVRIRNVLQLHMVVYQYCPLCCPVCCRPWEIVTKEFGKKWGSLSHERRQKVPCTVKTPQEFHTTCKEQLYFHPVEIIREYYSSIPLFPFLLLPPLTLLVPPLLSLSLPSPSLPFPPFPLPPPLPSPTSPLPLLSLTPPPPLPNSFASPP